MSTTLVGRQMNQAARISAGAQDGSLTKAETAKLAGQQLVTDKMLVSSKRDDGVVGPKERVEIRARQAHTSADVFEQRHDGQTRPAPAPTSDPAAASTSTPAPAAEHPRVDRQQNQAQRISDGVQDGSLTKAETARLAGFEVRTDAYLAKSKADDGKIGPVESAVVEKRQDATSKAIFVQKHDDQTR